MIAANIVPANSPGPTGEMNMKTYFMQYRTDASMQWRSTGKMRAKSHAHAIARLAKILVDEACGDSLEISACVDD